MSSSSSVEGSIPFALIDLLDDAGQLRVGELARGEVDRDADGAASGCERLPGGGLPAGLLEHPAADRHDQPRVLGDGDEARRADQAPLGVVASAPAPRRPAIVPSLSETTGW